MQLDPPILDEQVAADDAIAAKQLSSDLFGEEMLSIEGEVLL